MNVYSIYANDNGKEVKFLICADCMSQAELIGKYECRHKGIAFDKAEIYCKNKKYVDK